MRNSRVRFLLAPIMAAVLAACAVGPNYDQPQTLLGDSFAAAASATFSGTAAVPQFWSTFGDATLNELVAQAVAANYDLRIAQTRVREARALRRDAAFELAPSINASAGRTRQHTADIVTQPGAPRVAELYDVGFDA